MFYIFLFGLCCFALASVAWHRRRSQFVFRADQQLMASTSTQLQQDGASLPSGSSSWKYDVFLSFRGTDTRNGFVDHLYSALHQKVIFTFKDDQRLEKGDSISLALVKAIEESRFAVVVFSEKYTSSKWCLEELVKILECQKKRALTVLPVFYKVDPSDLRNQRGSVGKAFAQHKRDSSEEKVQRWRNALTKAANSSGWHSETYGPEAKLVQDIAIDILNRLGYNGSSILKDVVGLHPRIAKVMSLLEMGLDLDDPRIIGICGMGGIGKTTIAKAVYHQIRSQFDGSCYLANVRETCEKHGLKSLQKSLLVDIRSVSNSDIKIRDIDWPGLIRNAVGNMRVLVVLDDVDHSDQLDALVGRLDSFGSGSRIIITTRDEHLLARYGPRSHVYNVEGLHFEEASKLFCCKAFWKNQPTPGFEDLIKSAVDYANGVPLALKVLGCFLIGREVNEWQSAIRRLRQEPNPDIQKVLKLSYDGLGREEKKIFLDIACFFKWYSMEYSTVVNMLDACGFHTDIGISVLKDRALVTIKGNTIGMHDLIQEMGWHIVNEEFPEEPGERSRLWKYKDIYHTLTKNTGTKAVETIVLDSHGTKEIFLSPDAFSKMSKLRLLKLRNVQLPNGLDYLSNDLRLLDWHGYPLKYLPSNFQPDCLVTVNLSHSCLKLWNGRMGGANLKKLILEGCTNLVEISSIEANKSLTFLNLEGLKNLEVLPSGICGLKLLTWLNVSGCSKLSKLPENLGELERLKYICLKNCKELKTLPYFPANIRVRIVASGCTSLETLTDPAIFPRQLDGSLTNCHTLLKKRPSLLLELLRNILKEDLQSFVDFLSQMSYLYRSFIVVPGGEIPEGFRYQNNMGHYVGIQLRPDWYERLRGIFVCAVFEATAPSIDDNHYAYADCYVMWNDDVLHSTKINITSVQFQSDHLFLHYIPSKTWFGYDWVGEIRRRRAEVNDLKKNEIIIYFRRSHSPDEIRIGGRKLIVPVKCGVHMVYENDEEWPDHPHLTIQLSDYDEYGPIEWMQGVPLRKRSRHDYDCKEDTTEQPNPKRFRDVQWRETELLETSIQNFLCSKVERKLRPRCIRLE